MEKESKYEKDIELINNSLIKLKHFVQTSNKKSKKIAKQKFICETNNSSSFQPKLAVEYQYLTSTINKNKSLSKLIQDVYSIKKDVARLKLYDKTYDTIVNFISKANENINLEINIQLIGSYSINFHED